MGREATLAPENESSCVPNREGDAPQVLRAEVSRAEGEGARLFVLAKDAELQNLRDALQQAPGRLRRVMHTRPEEAKDLQLGLYLVETQPGRSPR